MWACIRNASIYKPFQYRFRIFIWVQVCLIKTFLVYFSTVLLICYITCLSTFYFLYFPLKWKCSKCMFQMHITSPIYVYRYTFFRMSSFVVLFINLYTFFINNLLSVIYLQYIFLHIYYVIFVVLWYDFYLTFLFNGQFNIFVFALHSILAYILRYLCSVMIDFSSYISY